MLKKNGERSICSTTSVSIQWVEILNFVEDVMQDMLRSTLNVRLKILN